MLQQTTIDTNRADFNKSDFERIIDQKGRLITYEQSLMCPCKVKSGGNLSDCKNCGGSGWLFINPIQAKAIVTAVSVTNEFKAWSEEARGTINITTSDSIPLSFMDRITLLDGKAIYTETVQLKKTTVQGYFHFLAYQPKKILYIAKFQGSNLPLLRLDPSNIILEKNVIRLHPSFITLPNEQISLVIRYVHAPVFHIMEMKRETMQNFIIKTGREINQDLPISAIARRAHYIIDAQNLTVDRILNNNYQEQKNCALGCEVSFTSTQVVTIPNNLTPPLPSTDNFNIQIPFTLQIEIIVIHNLGRRPDILIYNTFGEEVLGEIIFLDLNRIKIKFNQPLSGTIIM